MKAAKTLLCAVLILTILLSVPLTVPAAQTDAADTGNAATVSYTMAVGDTRTLYPGSMGVSIESAQWDSNDSAVSITSGYTSTYGATIKVNYYVSYTVLVTYTAMYYITSTVGGREYKAPAYTSKTYRITIEKPNTVTPTEAPYTPSPTTYTITFDPGNGTTATTRYTVAYNRSITFPTCTPSNSAYTFSHWADAYGNTYNAGTTKTVYSNQSYTAVYKLKALSTPKIIKAENIAKGTKITWGKVSGAVKYRVFVKSGSSWKKLGDTTATSYTNTNVKSGTTYTYTVRCITADGKSHTSAYDKTGKKYTFIKQPTGVKTTNAANGAKLTWAMVTGAKAYRVFVKSGSSWKKLGDTKSATYTHKQALPGYSYTYTVRCITADGKSYTSSYNTTGWTHKYSKKGTLNTPKISSLTNVSNGTKITWGKISGAAKYRVFVKSGSKWNKLGDTTATSYINQSSKAGTKYTYTVCCISIDGKKYTSMYDPAGKSYTYIKAPSGVKITNVDNGQKITWIKSAGAAKYRVYIKSGSTWKKLGDTTGTSYTNTNVKSGTTYTYTVGCISSDGKTQTSVYNNTGWKCTATYEPIPAGKRRYYFLMPDGKSGPKDSSGNYISSWYVAGVTAPYLYPMNGVVAYPGYKATKSAVKNIYYVDVDTSVAYIIWSNGTAGTQYQTINITSEYYYPGESKLYPNGVDNFNKMIYVLDPNVKDTNPFTSAVIYSGEWYYYYGNGCYGTNKGGASSIKTSCLNPDHKH